VKYVNLVKKSVTVTEIMNFFSKGLSFYWRTLYIHFNSGLVISSFSVKKLLIAETIHLSVLLILVVWVNFKDHFTSFTYLLIVYVYA